MFLDDGLSNLNLYFVEKNKTPPQKSKKTNESELMEVDNLIKGHKRSLFVDLPKEIELKISDLTIDQQVIYHSNLNIKFKLLLNVVYLG